MKQSINFFIFLLFSFLLINSCCNTTCPEESGLFPDPNFEKVIRLALEQPEGDILKDDLKSLVRLDAGFPEDTIRDITGIEYCENLLTVDLSGSRVKDLGSLSKLKYLEELYLRYSDVDNLEQISKCENLEILHLKENNIADISPITKLKRLENVWLCSNNISEVSALNELYHLMH